MRIPFYVFIALLGDQGSLKFKGNHSGELSIAQGI